MTNFTSVRRVFLLGVACVVAAAGCQATNLIGEVRGQDGGPPASEDAEPGDAIIIGTSDSGAPIVDASGAGGARHTGAGGRPGVIIDASPGIVDAIVLGTGGSPGGPPDADVLPPGDASILVDASGGCPITYPATGFYGQNIAYPQGTTRFASQVRGIYTLAADVPLGVSLSFTMTRLSSAAGTDPAIGAVWYLTDSDFRMTVYDQTNNTQQFMSRLPGRNEVSIDFDGTGQARIDFYECGSPTPTRVEVINWAP